MSNKTPIHPAIQARIDFLKKLGDDVKNASKIDDIYRLYDNFRHFCANFKIVHELDKAIPYRYSEPKTKYIKMDLLADIDMVKNVCLSNGYAFSSCPYLINSSLLLTESVRKTLTGEQFDELLEMIQKKVDKNVICNRIKDFGIDVVSEILSSIITNQILQEENCSTHLEVDDNERTKE